MGARNWRDLTAYRTALYGMFCVFQIRRRKLGSFRKKSKSEQRDNRRLGGLACSAWSTRARQRWSKFRSLVLG